MPAAASPAAVARNRAPASPAMVALDVTRAWAARTLRARYQQSAFGWAWAVVQPVAMVAIFTVVFTRFVRIETGGIPYVLFAYTATVPWTLLANAWADMAGSLVANLNLVTKIAFPRAALPAAALVARAVDFGIGMVLLLALVVAYGMPVTVQWLWVPVIVAVLVTFTLGLGLASSALNVFYRDVDPAIKLLTQLWFYASPIIYPTALVPDEWRWLYYANPVAGVIDALRDVLLLARAPGPELAAAAAMAVVALAAGYAFFRRVEGRLADVI
ncbi:MAG: ABC transporter permease [Acidobacteria bacterium]|nr:ABC transporter permease [Acidobacteriota bacterium]